MDDFRREARSAAQRLVPGARVLEVAPGPGYFAIELARLGAFRITGLDISRSFVEIASANAREAGMDIDFRRGNASAMPFAADSFDFIYCSAAFKNFSEPVAALNEMHRVLRVGGEAVVVDLRKDVSRRELGNYLKHSGRSRLDSWITKWTFRCMLMKRAYPLEDFRRLVAQSRFGGCEINLGPIGFEARMPKPSPVAKP